MARQSTPSRQSPSNSPRRSPRQSVSQQSPPRRTTIHQFVDPRPRKYNAEVSVHIYRYHLPCHFEVTHAQSGKLYYRTIPERFNPFMSDGLWSFSPRSGVARTGTLGRKIGDIHFSLRPGMVDATFYVCVPNDHDQVQWVEVERGFRHPVYPTHVLFQRGRTAPRWVLAETFAKYVHLYYGNFSVFNE